jgi:hypothetical protein
MTHIFKLHFTRKWTTKNTFRDKYVSLWMLMRTKKEKTV